MSTRSTGAARQTLPDSRPAPKRGREPESPDTPTSPPRSAGPLTRKRAASLRTDPRIEDLSLNTPAAASSSSHHPVEKIRERELICLCTPAPKVPRPRNAFILYRQHHQANVVAQNPGLANPEISKIIGERWRDETDENKDQWKRLAEEEKQHHQRKYPDYRYQPRRGGKGAANTRAATPTDGGTGDPGRCPKCGGRYIATPRTPGAAGSTATPFPFTAGTPGPVSRAGSMGSGYRGEMDRPGPGLSRGSFAGYGPPAGHHLGYQGHHLQGIAEDYEMGSPSEKRRRYDGYGEVPMQQQQQQHDSRQPSYGGPQYGYPHPYPQHMRSQQQQQQQQQQPQYARRGSTSSGVPSPAYPPPNSNQNPNAGPLPGPSLLGRGSVGANMAPPPRPGSVAYPPGRRDTGTGGPFDESLRLPPLQTSAPPNHTGQQQLPPAQPHHPPSQGVSPISEGASTVGPSRTLGVEAMIMSIPYANKLKVLEKISPPLAPPDGTPQFETRGPVIAIEGPNPALVRQVGAIIERALAASGECVVRSWSSAAQTPPPSSSGSGMDRGVLKFSGYLQTIQEWHGRSEEIVRYITTAPEAERRSSDVSMSEGDMGKKSSVSDQGDASSSTSEAVSNASTTPIPSRSQREGSSHLPVALLTDGFSLTLSDRFACRVPIGDSYAPVDHWQWMATLWRGIVGPDLVVYVRSPEEEEMRDGRLQAVELKGVGIMMVRVVNPGQGEMVVGEKVERRLGFEVVEWVRSGSFKEGF